MFKDKLMITVDWDYFISEPLQADWSHKECAFFLNDIWAFRAMWKETVKARDHYIHFWEDLSSRFDLNCPVYVSDSHAMAMEIAIRSNSTHVLNFDAHHDLWPLHDREINSVQCDDWATAFCEIGMGYYWMRPDGIELQLDLPKDRPDDCFLNIWPSVPKDSVVAIHICRSGCWTPPWCDADFILFVEQLTETFGLNLTALQSGDWHPMKDRWANIQDSGVIEQLKKITLEVMAKK